MGADHQHGSGLRNARVVAAPEISRIEAVRKDGLLEVLAEPTLVAVSGRPTLCLGLVAWTFRTV